MPDGSATAITRFTLFVVVAAALIGGCGGGRASGDGRPVVLATTSVLGDLARGVAGEAATVEVIMPLGADPHDYRPSAQDVAAIARADLVVANGLGLEEGLGDVLAAAQADGVEVLEIGPELDPLPLPDRTGGGFSEALDPHVWLDPLRMAEAAALVAEALEAIAPNPQWGVAAEAYAAELAAVDEEIAGLLAAIPPQRRKLVTNHDSLGYFAARYGLEVVGVVVPGGSTLAEPSSAELAELVDTIVREGVPAVFAETTEPTLLAEAVAAEVGSDVTVVEVFAGSLGAPGSGADTLVGMLRTNARRIVDALT